MARNGAGVYSLPAGSTVANGDTSDASDLNTPLQDLEADMNTPRPVVAGGTGATTAANARTNLGLAIGTNVQAYDAGLQSISGLTTAADKGIYTTAADTYATFDLTAAGRALLDDANAAAQRTTLGLGALATAANVTTSEIAAATLVVAADALFSNDNDTTIPTSAAVIDAIGAIMIVQDQKTAGTGGGTFNSGSWQTRTLNTTVVNGITGASLGSNQITLPAGTYRIRASAAALRVNNHQARLQNITAGTTLLSGTSEITEQSGAIVSNRSHIDGTFTLGATSALEVQHQCSTGFATSGFGSASGFGTEVYTTVEIQKIG